MKSMKYEALKVLAARHGFAIEDVARGANIASSILRRWDKVFPKPPSLLKVASAIRILAGEVAAWEFVEGAGEALKQHLAVQGEFNPPSPIRIVLPFPPSSNTAYPSNRHGGGRHLSKAGAAWKSAAESIIATETLGIAKPSRFRLELHLWMPDKRERDVDNYIKLPKDALCSVWGIKDDFNIIPSVTATYRGIERGGRCEMLILEVQDDQ